MHNGMPKLKQEKEEWNNIKIIKNNLKNNKIHTFWVGILYAPLCML